MTLLERALALVRGDRQDAYGSPLDNHERIARFFNARLHEKLKEPITAGEVPALMRLVKEARLMQTPGHRDSLVDIAGYSQVEGDIYDELDARTSKEEASP